MGKYNTAVITTAGQSIFASAIAGRAKVTFTKMQTSSYEYPETTDLSALTSLTDVVQETSVFSAEVFNGNVVQVSGRVDNAGISTAYFINAIGLYAQLGTSAPVLVAVVTAITPDQMPEEDTESPSAFIYNIQLTVQSASSITVTVTPAGTVTIEMLDGYVKWDDLNDYLEITVPTTGWTGTAPPYTVTVSADVTADITPFPFINYPFTISRTNKKKIDKAASLFTKLETTNGAVIVYACEVPQTAVPLALRGV